MYVYTCAEKLTLIWLKSCAQMVANYHAPLTSCNKISHSWKYKNLNFTYSKLQSFKN